MGGSGGGAKIGMKGPFSSTAGRTAATNARLDTLPRVPCAAGLSSQEPLFILTFFPPLPGSYRGLGTALGEKILSKKPEWSNRTAEGQGQILHSVPELDTSLKPREQWEEKLWDSVVPTWPLSGQQGKGL